MSFGIPSRFAPILLSRALTRQLFVYAAFSLIIAEIALIAMGVNAGEPLVVFSAALITLPGLVLLRFVFSPPTIALTGLYVALGALVLFGTATEVLSRLSNAPSTALAPFALISFAMILASGVASTVAGRFLWAVIGLAGSMLSLWAAAAVTGAQFQPDARTVIAALVVIGIAFIVPGQVTLVTKSQAAFDESMELIEVDRARAAISHEAVARLHDTLLSDLTVLTKLKPGQLSPEVRDAVETQLAQLLSTDWLVASIAKSDSARANGAAPSAAAETFVTALDEAIARGLEVNVSGDLTALAVLNDDSAVALASAVSQCLLNVIAHSGTSAVDVVVLDAGDAVTVTVIDAGVGFVPLEVPQDRLGLRISVRSRIEAVGGFVKVWSAPGQGTAVMLQLPSRRAA